MVVGDLAEATDVVIIGAGPGGYVAAIRLAQLGKEVTLVSKDSLPGGECLLRGCIPSKALIEAANLFDRLEGAREMGIEIEGARVNLPALQKWKQEVIQRLGKGTESLLKQNSVVFLKGEAAFLDPRTVEIRSADLHQQMKFKNAIIATGSTPTPLKGFPFDGKVILSSDDALSLEKIPKSLLVIGGGYIGLELGEVYAKLGSQVTVVEATEDILPGIEPELRRPLKKRLKELKVEIYLKTLAKSFRKTSSGVSVELESNDGKLNSLEFQQVFVAVGRSPRTAGLNLQAAGLQPNDRGFIPINEKCQSSVPHIYAIGDVAGGMMLAHKASREGIVAAHNIAGQADGFDNQVPAVIFTDPEIAYVGWTEAQAKDRGIEVLKGMFGFGANGRALTMNETEGFIKVVAEKESHRILGVQMVGPHVSELISEATLAIEMGAMIEDLDLTIHPHPTLSEALKEAAESALGISIHRYQRR